MSRPGGNKSALYDVAATGLLAGVALLPRSLVLRSARAAGGFATRFLGEKRDRVEHNLRLAGAADPERGVAAAGASMAMTMFEFAWLLGQTRERVLAQAEHTGLDALREALAGGRGVLLVGGHLGNWELIGQVATTTGAPLAGIARGLGTPRLERRIAAFRERGGITTLVRGERGVSVAAYRWLRKGGILACMMDRMSGGRRTVIPFLGEGLNVPVGPMVLAAKAGSAVVLGSATRRDDLRTDVSFRRLPEAETGDAVERAHAVGRALEAAVRARPAEWYWISRRIGDAPELRALKARRRERREARDEARATAGAEADDAL